MVYRYTKQPTQRQLKVAEAIKEVVADMFVRNEFGIPFFDHYNVSVSNSRISADLKLATLFLIMEDGAPSKDAIDWLNTHAGLVKKTIAKKLDLRVVPVVRFTIDQEFINTARIEKLLKQ